MSDRAWTFMVFMAGDNNLSAAGDADLEEMRRVGSTKDVSVVVEFDNAGDHGTRRFHVERRGEGERVVELGETDSGSPEVLIDFVEWAAGEYPADRYALVLWNHGGGWEPSELDRIARSVDSPDYSERELSVRSSSSIGRAFFRSTLEEIFAKPTAKVRSILSDDGTGHSLDTIELGRVLTRVASILGQPLDILGCDACLMANLEVAYEVKPYARFYVGSEENEPNQGWPYDRILQFFTEHPDAPAAEMVSHIVDSYAQWYQDLGHGGPITQAGFDLGEFPKLFEPLDVLAGEIEAHLPGMATAVWKAQRASARFHRSTLWDLNDFSGQLTGFFPHISPAVGSVRGALAPGPGEFVVAERHLGGAVQQCGGASLYLIPPILPISPYYGELAFARERAWYSMLKKYHES